MPHKYRSAHLSWTLSLPFSSGTFDAVSSESTEPGWDPEEIPDVKVIADSGELLGRVNVSCVSFDDSFRAYHLYVCLEIEISAMA